MARFFLVVLAGDFRLSADRSEFFKKFLSLFGSLSGTLHLLINMPLALE